MLSEKIDLSEVKIDTNDNKIEVYETNVNKSNLKKAKEKSCCYNYCCRCCQKKDKGKNNCMDDCIDNWFWFWYWFYSTDDTNSNEIVCFNCNCDCDFDD